MNLTYGDVLDGILASALAKLISKIRFYKDKVLLMPLYDAVRVAFPERHKVVVARLELYKDYNETRDGLQVINVEKMPPDLREMFVKERADEEAFVLLEIERAIVVTAGSSVLNDLDLTSEELFRLRQFVDVREVEDGEVERLRARVKELEQAQREQNQRMRAAR